MELDPKTFKALGSGTRVSLLKKLRGKPRSLSTLAHELGLSVQSVHEQMEKLADAGLVQKTRRTKWAYYSLSNAGARLLAPSPTPVYLMLGVSVVLFFASAWTSLSQPIAQQTPTELHDAYAKAAQPLQAAEAELPSPMPPAPSAPIIPWTEIFALGGALALLAAGTFLWKAARK